MKRTQTRLVKIGNLEIGASNKILIQSMCNIKTSNTDEVIAQINECERLGADLMRVSVLDKDDAYALKKITSSINIPLVADIHFSKELAILSILNGAKKIRLNPGNLKNVDEIKEIIELAKVHNVAIRIGVNGGSLDEDIKNEFPDDKESTLIVKSALKYASILENLDFKNIVISLKSTNVFTTIEAYREFSKISDYPLHIGLTESGFDEVGIIRSCAALSPLLLEGIGNTIRISLTSDPYKEIKTCKRLLHDLNLYDNYPTLISCPTCGRCKVNPKPLAIKTLKFLEDNNINLKVAIMGCIVNGIGEGKSADIGLAGGDKSYIIFKDGKVLKTVQEENALDELFNEILKMSKER